MKIEKTQWTWSDGWLLMSVYLAQCNETCGLPDIIAYADATNHAIPSPDELIQAFTKLVNSGVLNIKNNNYLISEQYFPEVERAYNGKGGLFKSGEKGLKWLKSSKLPMIGTPEIIITEELAKNAYNEYKSSIKKNG